MDPNTELLAVSPSDDKVEAMERAFAELPDTLTGADIAAFFHGVMNRYDIEGERRLAVIAALAMAVNIDGDCDCERCTAARAVH